MEKSGQVNLMLLVGSIIHEFKNILTGIHGYSQLILNSINGGSSDDTRQYIEKLEYAATRGLKWSEKMLSAVKIDEIVLYEEVDINEVAFNIVEFMKLIITKDIQIQLELSDRIAKIKGDPFQIEQGLMNLIINACQSMPAGGLITVRTHRHIEDNGDYLAISVSDAGGGISVNMQNRIQKPFFSTKNGKGTGLGLYVVSIVMKNHGGRLNIHSEIDKGSRFEMIFPA